MSAVAVTWAAVRYKLCLLQGMQRGQAPSCSHCWWCAGAVLLPWGRDRHFVPSGTKLCGAAEQHFQRVYPGVPVAPAGTPALLCWECSWSSAGNSTVLLVENRCISWLFTVSQVSFTVHPDLGFPYRWKLRTEHQIQTFFISVWSLNLKKLLEIRSVIKNWF